MSSLGDLLLAHKNNNKLEKRRRTPSPGSKDDPKDDDRSSLHEDRDINQEKVFPNRVEKEIDRDDVRSEASSTDDYVRELLDPDDRPKNVWHVVEGPKVQPRRDNHTEISHNPVSSSAEDQISAHSADVESNNSEFAAGQSGPLLKEEASVHVTGGSSRGSVHDKERTEERSSEKSNTRREDEHRDSNHRHESSSSRSHRHHHHDRDRRDRDRDRRRDRDHDRHGRHRERSGRSSKDLEFGSKDRDHVSRDGENFSKEREHVSKDRDPVRRSDKDRDNRSRDHRDRVRDERDRSRDSHRSRRRHDYADLGVEDDGDIRHRSRRGRRRSRSRSRESGRRCERSRSESQSPITKRNSRTILIMQLSPRVDSRDLEDFFTTIGRVREVRLIMDSKTRRHKGIAYIEFEDAASAEKASALNGEEFQGAPMVIQSAQMIDRNNRPSDWGSSTPQLLNQTSSHPSSRSHLPPNCYRVYVGGLHVNLTEDMIRSVFEPFGPIIRIELMKDRVTNVSRGYAFITYANIEDGQSAVQALDGFELAGKALRVSKSTDK